MRTKIASVLFILAVCAFSNPVSAGERFTDNGDGTVTDHRLGLMWAKSTNVGDINWHEAGQWIRFTFPDTIPANHTDWRLPTLEELKSLYDKTAKGYETNCGRRVKIDPTIRLDCGWIWTSERKSITAIVYNFQRGYHYTERMVQKRHYRALPVRSIR